MSGKVKVPLFQAPLRCTTLEQGATVGAIFGVNLRWPDGTLVTAEDFAPEPDDSGNGLARTLWRLVLEIPPNVTALAELTGVGVVRRTGDSTFDVNAGLDDLSDVDAPSPVDRDALCWSAGDGAWRPLGVVHTQFDESVDGVKTFTGNGPVFAGKATQLRSDKPSFQFRTPASTRRYRLRYEATEAKDGPFLIQKREAGAWYERLSISDDTLQVRHNNQLVTDTTIPPGGIYTPALTNGANVTASDTWVWSYIRIGYAVSMSGQLVVTPTVDAALTTLRVSLPIESTLNDARDIGGSGSFTVSGVAGPVFVAADPASDDLLVSFYASGTDPHVVGVSIVYPVQPIIVIEPYTDETGAVYVDDDENVYYYVGTA